MWTTTHTDASEPLLRATESLGVIVRVEQARMSQSGVPAADVAAGSEGLLQGAEGERPEGHFRAQFHPFGDYV